MDITSAMSALKTGRSIRRPTYPAGCRFKLAANPKRMIMVNENGETEINCLSFNSEDINATDWEVLD